MRNTRNYGLACLVGITSSIPLCLAAQEAATTDEDIYLLSPFEVTADGNVGYYAASTLAGTRLKTDYRDVGSAVSVVTKEFLKDTGATGNSALLLYTTNTEVAGIGGNFTNVSNGGTSYQSASSFLTPSAETRVRGLCAADNTRDFFVSDIPWDSFDVNRVDLQRGPNSILFGLGSPAGIINTDMKDAQIAGNSGELEARYGRFGSYRASVDLNYVILKDELAVRVDGLLDKNKYQQKPAYSKDKRVYGAVRYEPKLLNGHGIRTTLSVNGEAGKIESNNPRSVTPGDFISPWFDSMNKLTIDPYDNQDNESKRPNTGQEFQTYSDGTTNPYYNPYIGNWGQLYGGVLAIWDDSNSSAMRSSYFAEPEHTDGYTPSGKVVGGVSPALFRSVADYATYANNVKLPGSELGQYKTKYMTDPTIFDFYHVLLDGDNKSEEQDWTTLNLTLSQGFFDETLGYEISYNKQNYSNEILRMLANERQNIYIDINKNLPDGSPNPNVGRAFVTDSGRYGNGANSSDREDLRVSTFANLDINNYVKEKTWLTKLVGRHVFNAVWSKTSRYQTREEFQRYVSDAAFGEHLGAKYADFQVNDRQINTVHYLGGSLMNATTASGANLPGLSAIHKPSDGSVYFFDTHWTADSSVDSTAEWTDPRSGVVMTEADNPDNYVGWTTVPFNVLDATNPDEHYYTITNLTKIRDTVTSKVAVWQGYLWDGALVGTVGYRKDTTKNWTKTADKNANSTMNLDTFEFVDEPSSTQSGKTTSWSVVAHLNEFVEMKWMPVDISVFYNSSENFQPGAGRVDVLGRPLPAPSGDTKDYGFMISTKDQRYSARINWYKTTVLNDANNTLAGCQWVIGIAENWAHAFATRFRDNVGNDPDFTVKGDMTLEETKAEEAAAIAAWFANPPTEIIKAWGGNLSTESLYTSAQTTNPPAGMTATADTVSEGLEIELTANPLKNLRLTLNASRSEAKQTNVGGTFTEYVDSRLEYYRTTAAGKMRVWWSGGDTILQQLATQAGFLGQYELMKLQEGTAQPELRKWRFNAIANYTFDDSFFKGFGVGGAIRWQDDVVIGYPLTTTDDGTTTFDLAHPYRGEARTNYDLWISYERALTDKVGWKLQLNIMNAFAKNELIPISTQPDGTPAAVRIAPAMTWEITSTFTF